MRWFLLLLASSQLLGCGCRDASVAPNEPAGVLCADSPDGVTAPQESPAKLDQSPQQTAEREPLCDESLAAQDEAPRFAPNDRYGWPEDFLLPLVIEFEPTEVPEAIRGPSPPIEQPQ